MSTYNAKNYTEQGGDTTHFGGKVIFEEGCEVEGLTPQPSQLPIASEDTLGCVKIGDGIEVSEDGTISADGYQKPEDGIPGTDLSEDVQSSLEKAESALQEHQSLAAYALITETGYKLNLEMNSSTFVVTPKLYDKNNNLISTGEPIDLPLESVVVSGDYDYVTKKVILVLKNGSQIEFSIADLIDGLVSESDFEAHTDNTGIHVTSSEKTYWNGKANAQVRETTGVDAISLEPNKTKVATNALTTFSVTLDTPATGIDSEYRLIFKAGSDCQITVYPPAGYTVLGASDLTFTEDNLYEMSFALLDDTYIGCICKEWEISE